MQIGKARILIIATDGFEEHELFGPRAILGGAGASVTVASFEARAIQGTTHDVPGATITAEITFDEVNADDYDALLIPGGVINPDAMRMHARPVEIVRQFADAGKPVAAICHGPWMLVEADVVRGRTVTSWPSIRTDLKNAGAEVVDREVVTDGHIITSRQPEDVEAFTAALIHLLEGRRAA